jgi:hypothetical protein
MFQVVMGVVTAIWELLSVHHKLLQPGPLRPLEEAQAIPNVATVTICLGLTESFPEQRHVFQGCSKQCVLAEFLVTSLRIHFLFFIAEAL